MTDIRNFMSTVWSAAPTPLLPDGRLDEAAVERLSDHHYRLGIRGVFIGGTAGEGGFLARRTLKELAAATVRANRGRMATALQITDNSAERMIENIRCYLDTGVELFVLAPPFSSMRPDQAYLYDLYCRVIDASPLPVVLYHRGTAAPVVMTGETVAHLAEHPKVVTLKDSAGQAADTRAILVVRDRVKSERPMYVYSGDEFDCVGAALAGYDGLTIGGGCFNGAAAARIFELARRGELDEAGRQQRKLNELMLAVFGGPDLHCWLAGEKQLLVELGIFSSSRCVINYRLDAECAAHCRRIARAEAEFFLPQPEHCPVR